MKSLLEFYNDKDTRENVRNYLIEYLEKEAIRRVFEKEDVSSIGDAKEVIDKAFDNLGVLFNPQIKKKEIVNEAR